MKKIFLIMVVTSLIPLFAQARVAVKPAVKPATTKAFKINPLLGAQSKGALNIFGDATQLNILHTLSDTVVGTVALKTVENGFEALTESVINLKSAEQVDALGNALAESTTWDLASQKNLVAFIGNLADGVSVAEANKLNEVTKNCKL